MKMRFWFIVALVALLLAGWWVWPEKISSADGPPPSRQASRRVARTNSGPPPQRPSSGTVARLMKGDNLLKLDRRQVDDFLQARNRSADALLCANRMTRDNAYLEEALEKFPGNSQVLLAAIQKLQLDSSQRLDLAEKLSGVDSDNGLGYQLGALALLEMGRSDEALAKLENAAGKPIEFYVFASSQTAEEALSAIGISPLESRMSALYNTENPSVMALKKLSDQLDELRAASPDEDAANLRDLQGSLGRELQNSGTVMDSQVGILIEKRSLAGLDPAEAESRLQELATRKEAIVKNAQNVSAMMNDGSVPDSEWLFYFDRMKQFGEQSANAWMLERYPQ